MSLSKPQLLVVIITPMITGTISTVASATIIVSIFRSEIKFSTIYRRFIFGMSAFDVIRSIFQLLSSLPVPTNSPIWGAVGNNITCGMQSFMQVIGVCGAVLYSLSLVSCYFQYLCMSSYFASITYSTRVCIILLDDGETILLPFGS